MNEVFISQDFSTLALLFEEGLYRVNSPKNQTNTGDHMPANLTIEGKFSNGILFIIERQNETADSESLQLLQKSLVGLSIDINECGITWQDILTVEVLDQAHMTAHPRKIILFGKIEGPKSIEKNQVINHKGAAVLYCDFLNNIARQQASKVSWWTSFKPFLLQS